MTAGNACFDVTSFPHRSLGVEGFRALLIVVIVLNVIGSIVFVVLGAWPVAGFLGLDVLAVYVAFKMSYAQARAYERIMIDGAQIVVERVDAHGERQVWRAPSYWASVWFEGDETRGTVTLRSHGKSIEVGRYLSAFERKPFAAALGDGLRSAKAAQVTG